MDLAQGAATATAGISGAAAAEVRQSWHSDAGDSDERRDGPSVDVERDVAHLFALSQRICAAMQERTTHLVQRERALAEETVAERQRIKEDHARAHDALQRERERLESVRGRALGIAAASPVSLNVGGVVFSSSRETLSADANSVLSVLVNGGFPVETDAEGAILIDRSPRFFGLILSHLRALRDCAEQPANAAQLVKEASSSQRDAGVEVAAGAEGGAEDGCEMRRHGLEEGTPQSRVASLSRVFARLSDDERDELLAEIRYYNLESMEHAVRPVTLVVSTDGASRYRRVSEALQDARDGDTVVVRPGVYIDSFVMFRAVAIVGDGAREEVVIRSPAATAVECRGEGGALRNLTLEGGSWAHLQSASPTATNTTAAAAAAAAGSSSSPSASTLGPPRSSPTVADAGSLLISTIAPRASSALAGVLGTSGGSNGGPAAAEALGGVGYSPGPLGDHYGVLISEGAMTIDNCEIRTMGLSCIKVLGCRPHSPQCDVPPSSSQSQQDAAQASLSSARPSTPGPRPSSSIINCNIVGAHQCGILVTNHADVVIENNSIHHNRFSGIEIRNASTPRVSGNTIYENLQNGIYVHSGGGGAIRSNRIFANRFNGINAEGPVALGGNTIYDNLKRGIFHGAATAVESSNVVYNNALGDVAPKR